jgi:hypothetical protein
MAQFLEILKYTIPSLVLFATTYYLLKGFMGHQIQVEQLKLRQSQGKDGFGLKLNALERLTILNDRTSIDNLYYRLYHNEMGVNELRKTMMIAVQQEYEHNATQQLYVSEEVWQILSLAKDHTLNIIAQGEGHEGMEFFQSMKRYMVEKGVDPNAYVRKALKEESDKIVIV